MGYFVNGSCVSTKQQADVINYSRVAPAFFNGQLQTVEYKNGNYYYENQVLVSSYPECSPTSNFFAGGELGFTVAAAWFIAYGFIAIKRAIL